MVSHACTTGEPRAAAPTLYRLDTHNSCCYTIRAAVFGTSDMPVPALGLLIGQTEQEPCRGVSVLGRNGESLPAPISGMSSRRCVSVLIGYPATVAPLFRIVFGLSWHQSPAPLRLCVGPINWETLPSPKTPKKGPERCFSSARSI